MDALSAPDRLKLETARSIREDFLHQNAFHETDTFTPLAKQAMMMKLILRYYDEASAGLEKGIPADTLVKLPVRERIGRFKYVDPAQLSEEFDAAVLQLQKEIDAAGAKEEF